MTHTCRFAWTGTFEQPEGARIPGMAMQCDHCTRRVVIWLVCGPMTFMRQVHD